jgi:hypothetical protein
LTRALATVDDEVIAELAGERRALRDELRELRDRPAGVTRIEADRPGRGRRR